MAPREKLQRLLSERRLSQRDAADAAGVVYTTFQAYVSQQRKVPSTPGVDVAVRIAAFLQVPVEWLWSDADWPPPELAASGADVAHLPDAVVLEDVLRRKRALQTAMLSLVERYRQLRRLYRDALTPGADPVKLHTSYMGIRSMLQELQDFAGVYTASFKMWDEFEQRWAAVEILGNPNDYDTHEMVDTMMDLYHPQKTEAEALAAINRVLQRWGIPPLTEDRLKKITSKPPQAAPEPPSKPDR